MVNSQIFRQNQIIELCICVKCNILFLFQSHFTLLASKAVAFWYAIAARYTIIIDRPFGSSLFLRSFCCCFCLCCCFISLCICMRVCSFDRWPPKQFKSSVNNSRRHLQNFDYILLMYTLPSHMISLKKPFIFADRSFDSSFFFFFFSRSNVVSVFLRSMLLLLGSLYMQNASANSGCSSVILFFFTSVVCFHIDRLQ